MFSRLVTAAIVLLILASTLPAADPTDKDIQRAVAGGRKYLHEVYKPGGPGPGGFAADLGPGVPMVGIAPVLAGQNPCGPAALAGLALVESGATAADAAVSNILNLCREGAFSATATYDISLMIMFLDRIGASRDRPLIQLLTLRLLTGQNADGAWGYTCEGYKFDPVQERQLRAELLRDAKLVSPDGARIDPTKDRGTRPREDLDLPGSKRKDPAVPEPKKDVPKPADPGGLHPALKNLSPRGLQPPPGFGPVGPFGTNSDHSNTQFATVALWCGRRHAVPVTDALSRIDKYYRNCQGGDGGWSYQPSTPGSTPAMTCAGLMGLALGFGAKNLPDGESRAPRIADPEALNNDRVVMAGLKFVGDFIAAAGEMRDPRYGFQPNDLSNNLYFMWSLERVGMVYGLTTIGKLDWYDWGSRILVRTQQRDGSWSPDGYHSGGRDSATAFALLFLSRANLAEDLSNSLKGKVKDPGTSRLVGGKGLDRLLEGSASAVGSGTRRSSKGGETVPRPPTPPTPPDPPKDNLPRPRGDDPAPRKVDAAPIGNLGRAIVNASPADRTALIEKHRDSRGIEHTDALAQAAGQLAGEAQVQVREALASRLTRMTPATLIGMMAEPDRELRRAAALACGSKGKERLGEVANGLIGLIADEDAMVVQAARASLKVLTDQDFGPDAATSADDRRKAQADWKKWWAEQKR